MGKSRTEFWGTGFWGLIVPRERLVAATDPGAWGGWLLRAYDTYSPCPVFPAGGQLFPPARLSTCLGNQPSGGAWAQPLRRPIQGHRAGRKACLGLAWARCPGNEVQLPSGPPPWGQPLPANGAAQAPPYIRRGCRRSLWVSVASRTQTAPSAQPSQVLPGDWGSGGVHGWGP